MNDNSVQACHADVCYNLNVYSRWRTYSQSLFMMLVSIHSLFTSRGNRTRRKQDIRVLWAENQLYPRLLYSWPFKLSELWTRLKWSLFRCDMVETHSVISSNTRLTSLSFICLNPWRESYLSVTRNTLSYSGHTVSVCFRLAVKLHNSSKDRRVGLSRHKACDHAAQNIAINSGSSFLVYFVIKKALSLSCQYLRNQKDGWYET